MKEIAGAAALAAVIITGIVADYWWGRRREVLMLQEWAQKTRLGLLHFRQRKFFEPAPFTFWTSHRQPSYFVTVRDQLGNERSGWVRLGTISASIYGKGKERVEVKWNEIW